MDEEYGVIEEKQAQPKFPVRSLLRVHHQGTSLIVSGNAFGPNWFKDNVAEMNGSFCYPKTREVISFREPTTSESISAIAYQFTQIAKPEILDPRWFQAGRVLRTGEGVWANLPRDAQGNLITDEQTLKTYLQNVAPIKVGIGNVYIVPNREGLRDFGYAEYGSFEWGVQESVTFANGGLARIFEHTEGTATNLLGISSKENYKRGVDVCNFDKVKGIILRVVGLSSGRGMGRGKLCIDGGWGGGGGWGDGSDGGGGYAVGVLSRSAEGTL